MPRRNCLFGSHPFLSTSLPGCYVPAAKPPMRTLHDLCALVSGDLVVLISSSLSSCSFSAPCRLILLHEATECRQPGDSVLAKDTQLSEPHPHTLSSLLAGSPGMAPSHHAQSEAPTLLYSIRALSLVPHLRPHTPPSSTGLRPHIRPIPESCPKPIPSPPFSSSATTTASFHPGPEDGHRLARVNCSGLPVSLQSPYPEALTRSVVVLEVRPLGGDLGGQEGRALGNGICALIKGTPESNPACFLPHVPTEKKRVCHRKGALSRTRPHRYPDPGLPSSAAVRIPSVGHKPHRPWCFVRVARLRPEPSAQTTPMLPREGPSRKLIFLPPLL